MVVGEGQAGRDGPALRVDAQQLHRDQLADFDHLAGVFRFFVAELLQPDHRADTVADGDVRGVPPHIAHDGRHDLPGLELGCRVMPGSRMRHPNRERHVAPRDVHALDDRAHAVADFEIRSVDAGQPRDLRAGHEAGDAAQVDRQARVAVLQHRSDQLVAAFELLEAQQRSVGLRRRRDPVRDAGDDALLIEFPAEFARVVHRLPHAERHAEEVGIDLQDPHGDQIADRHSFLGPLDFPLQQFGEVDQPLHRLADPRERAEGRQGGYGRGHDLAHAELRDGVEPRLRRRLPDRQRQRGRAAVRFDDADGDLVAGLVLLRGSRILQPRRLDSRHDARHAVHVHEDAPRGDALDPPRADVAFADAGRGGVRRIRGRGLGHDHPVAVAVGLDHPQVERGSRPLGMIAPGGRVPIGHQAPGQEPPDAVDVEGDAGPVRPGGFGFEDLAAVPQPLDLVPSRRARIRFQHRPFAGDLATAGVQAGHRDADALADAVGGVFAFPEVGAGVGMHECMRAADRNDQPPRTRLDDLGLDRPAGPAVLGQGPLPFGGGRQIVIEVG